MWFVHRFRILYRVKEEITSSERRGGCVWEGSGERSLGRIRVIIYGVARGYLITAFSHNAPANKHELGKCGNHR